MRRLLNILPLSGLIFVLAILITMVIDNDVELTFVSFQTFTNVVTAISSILLLVIAIKLYKRFSGTQSIIEKQTPLVIQLVVLLSEAKFEIKQVKDDGKDGKGLLNVTIHGYKTHIKGGHNLIPESDYTEKKLYVDASIFKFLEHFWKLKYDAYLPRPIALLLRDDFGMMTHATFEKRELEEEHLEFCPMFYGRSDGLLWQPSDVNEIMKNMKNVYLQSTAWLRENNPEVYESLNLVSDRMPAYKD